LLLLQRKAANPQQTLEALSQIIVDSLIAITRALPPIALEDPEGDPELDECLTIPLLDVIPTMGKLVNAAMQPILDGFSDDNGLFRHVRKMAANNLAKIAERSRRVPN